jgi:hypothetical protein
MTSGECTEIADVFLDGKKRGVVSKNQPDLSRYQAI